MPDRHMAYISHVMDCPGCYAPRARYCEAGRALWAEYLANYIMGLPDRANRRAVMLTEKRQNPHLFDQLNRRVRELLDASGGDA